MSIRELNETELNEVSGAGLILSLVGTVEGVVNPLAAQLDAVVGGLGLPLPSLPTLPSLPSLGGLLGGLGGLGGLPLGL